jgi:hypothetical protein
MMPVIAQQAPRPYVAGMTAALLRLLTLLALVLMPLGMTSAPAAASPMPPSHDMAAMGHCDEQPGEDEAPVSKIDCTAMCTALPATDGSTPTSVLKLTAPRTVAVATPFVGMVPEIATPPPRQG